MSTPSTQSTTPPTTKRANRAVFTYLAVALVLCVPIWLGYQAQGEPDTAQLRFFAHVRTVLITLFLPLFALVVGYFVLRPVRERWGLSGEPSLVLSLALGWGLLSVAAMIPVAVVTSLTAVCGAPTSVFSDLLATPLNACCLIFVSGAILFGKRNSLRPTTVALSRSLCARTSAWRPIFASPWAVVAAVLFAFVVARQILCALTPPFLYDVLEYHLPQVRRILDGSLAPIVGNSYTKMPQAAEMLYALGRLLEGSSGELAPKLVHLYLAWTTALLLNALLRELRVVGVLRAVAVLLFLSHPVSFVLLSDAYVGMASAMFATAALLCWVRAMRLPNRLDLLLAAAFLGFAFATKYPVAGIAVVPFLFLLVPLGATHCLAGPIPAGLSARRLVASVFLLGAIVGTVYSPWLVRSWVFERSLFPPLTKSLVDNDKPYPRALQRFMAASHRPRNVASFETLVRARRRSNQIGTLLFIAAILYLLWPRGVDVRRRGLALYAVAGYAVWATSAYAPQRYLAPVVPAFIALGAVGASDLGRLYGRRARWVAGIVLAAWALWLTADQARMVWHAGWVRTGLGGEPRLAFLQRQLGLTGRFFAALNRLPPQTTSDGSTYPNHILMLYEARAAAMLPETRDRVTVNTVFDPCLLWTLMHDPRCDDPEQIVMMLTHNLVKRGFWYSYIAVNEVELARLIATFPVLSARRSRDWKAAMEEPSAGGFRPGMRKLWWYYAPFYYYGAPTPWRDRWADEQAAWERLERFIDYMAERAVWREDLNGARVFIAPLELPPERLRELLDPR